MKIGRYRAFAEEVTAALERGRYFYLICFCVLFLGMTALRAVAKPLWYDELFTYYMSRLPDAGMTWAALKDGADLCPPLIFLATRESQKLFGDGLIGTRLPAVLGFLTMLLCLYRFVAMRCGAAYGFAAMLFAALSGAYAYAYEARSYGLVLGFCGLSLIAWQAAANGQARRFALPVLCVSLAAALLTHCYAVLILIPLGLGEAVRSVRQRRMDWPVWLALAAAGCCVLVYLPLLTASRGTSFDNVTFRPTLYVLRDCYEMLATPLMAPLMIGLALVILMHAGTEQEVPEKPAGFPAHEIALAAGLALVPLYAYLVAKFVSHVFMTRYGTVAVLGLSILFAWFLDRAAGGRRMIGWALSLLFAVWFVSGFGIWMGNVMHSKVAASDRDSSRHVYELPPELVKTGLPFVASNGLFFLEADHYAPPSFVSRLTYLADPAAAVRYTGSDVFERGFPVMQKWFPIRARVESYQSFVRAHQHFLVFGEFDHPLGWVTKKLLDDGAMLRFLGQYHGPYGENLLLEVSMPPVQSALPPQR